VGKIKHILLDEGLFDLLVSPVNEKFVVKIGFFGEASRKIDGILKVCSGPIGF